MKLCDSVLAWLRDLIRFSSRSTAKRTIIGHNHTNMEIAKLKDTIQDSHINFLIGSGFSAPYLSTLGNIEILLTELEKSEDFTKDQKEIVSASLLGKFFESVIIKNVEILEDKTVASKDEILSEYKKFVTSLNILLLKRKSTILKKQVNIFTSNIDVFFEKAFEETQIEVNDGFSGRMKPIFSLTNFKKSSSKTTLHYDNIAEIPVFNLLKIHGSLTWKSDSDKITYSLDSSIISSIAKEWKAITPITVNTASDLNYFKAEVAKLKSAPEYSNFLKEYAKLAIVNPTKAKFRQTTLDLNYYELLRVFSNELEKENCLLFVMGFSIADEHIREVILRAANSNPTLLILIYCYDIAAKSQIETNLKKGNVVLRYNNIQFIASDTVKHDLKTINATVFDSLLKAIDTL